MKNQPLYFLYIAFIAIFMLVWRIIRYFRKKKHERFIPFISKRLINNKLKNITSPERGTFSEKRLILSLLKMNIPGNTIFHDIYLRKKDGRYSQIDLVVPTKVGVLVFEVKDYSGWIYGKGNQDHWTQVLAYGRKKYRFYNPVKQNEYHIRELQKQLGEDVPFFSIIVFFGNSKLKDVSFIPQGTFVTKWYRVGEIVSGILRFNLNAQYKNKQNVVNVLKQAVRNGKNLGTNIEHANNIRDMIGKDRVLD